MKRKISGILSIILLSAAVVSAAGCGEKTASPGGEVPATEASAGSQAAAETGDIAGSYSFMEAIMGDMEVPWTLTLNEDGTYELVCNNDGNKGLPLWRQHMPM